MAVNLIQPSIQDAVVEQAKELLRRCESGEVIGFTAIVSYKGGEFGPFGSPVESRTQEAGRLLDAALQRLGYGPQ